jgi:hypothetical protein
MMQQWADYLDKLKAGAEVIPLHGHAAWRLAEQQASAESDLANLSG